MSSLLNFSKTYKPFNHEWAVEITKKHEEIHWTEDEADLSEDVNDWKIKLTNGEKDFITNILRLFTQGDVQVGQNYYDFLIPKFKNNEVRVMLGSFAGREGTHQRAYALLNDTLGLPDEEFHKFLDYKEMSDKIDFMARSDSSTQSGLALSLAKSVLNEGVSLFASFVMLLNLQRFGKMKGMSTIVEWSIRDETVHVEGNSRLFREFCNEHPKVVNDEFKAKIYQMARDVVMLEDNFIDLAFAEYDIEGITKEDVKQYIRYITDRRLLQLGLKTNFKVKENPLTWLDWILNGVSHDNFFEKRVTEYSINGMEGDWDWGKLAGS
jgi:ribonucleotide reductase beta subunit family protein with ferritin-like domain